MTLNSNNWGKFSIVSEQIASTLFDIGSVKAFWLHGSRAINTHNDDSDIDLTLVLDRNDKTEVVTRLGSYLEYHPAFGDYFSDTTSELWLLNNGEVALHFITIDELDMKLEQFKSGVEGFEITQAFVQHTIVESSLIFDKIDIYNDMKAALFKGIPGDIRGKIIRKYLTVLNNKMMWWKIRPRWKNQFEELSDSHLIVTEIAKLHYAVNNRLFMPALKEYEHDLKGMAPNLTNEMGHILEQSKTVRQQELKRKTIYECIEKLNNHVKSLDLTLHADFYKMVVI